MILTDVVNAFFKMYLYIYIYTDNVYLRYVSQLHFLSR